MWTSMPAECPGHEGRANSQSRSPLDEQASSHICTQPRTHASRRAPKAPMSARAVAVTRPASTMIARLAFLHILSGVGPVARLSIPISDSMRDMAICRQSLPNTRDVLLSGSCLKRLERPKAVQMRRSISLAEQMQAEDEKD